jgi:hypothetical protein
MIEGAQRRTLVYIFVDESGLFRVSTKPHAVSCVAALIVPESLAPTLFRRFRKLIRPWRDGGSEVKGSSLDESQMAQVLKLLRRFDILVVASCMDLGSHTDAAIETHKHQQASVFLSKIPKAQNPEMARWLKDLGDQINALPNQLYAQAFALTDLVYRTLQQGTLYYAQRIPRCLGKFAWRIDAKGISITKYEKLWLEFVLPIVQTMSLTDPLVQMREADYSAFERFHKSDADPPDYLRPYLPAGSKPFESLDVREVVTEDLGFPQSHRYTGLQIVDIVASSITRACNGALQRDGWAGLGRLMVKPVRGGNALHFLALQKPAARSGKLPYNDIVKECDSCAKSMLAGSA